MAAAGFLSHYLSGSLPYVRHHITINKKNVLGASLNKTFPSFLQNKTSTTKKEEEKPPTKPPTATKNPTYQTNK